MLILYLLPLIALLFLFIPLISKGIITMKTRSTVVDESKYLKTSKTSVSTSSLMGNPIFPFQLQIDPMDKLILFDIEDDPLYSTLELQEFDDETSQGLIVLMYRKDKEIDVYHTEGIAHDFYQGSPKGYVGKLDPQEYHFEKSKQEFRFLILFLDKEGREIYIKAEEQNPGKKHFSILAPAGEMIDNFTSFPLFFMKQTAFLEKEHAQIRIRIDNEDRIPVAIPIAINGEFVYLSRYCLDPVVASFNENYKGILEPMAEDGPYQYSLAAGDLSALDYEKLNHRVSLKFAPPFPDLRSLKDGARMKGRFSTSVDEEKGILAGQYRIAKNQGKVSITLTPQKGWQPMPGKKWFKKYKWVSRVSLESGDVYGESGWEKK